MKQRAWTVDELTDWLELVESKPQAVEDAVNLLLRMLPLASYPDGLLPMTQVELAERVLVHRNKVRPRLRLLIRAGLVEEVSGGFRIPTYVRRVAHGDDRLAVLRLVLEGNRRWSQERPESAQAVPGIRASACPESGQPEEVSPLVVVDAVVDAPRDLSEVADVLAALSACCSEPIAENSKTRPVVSRLLAGGWTDAEIVAEMRRRMKRDDRPGLWVVRLGDLPESPPRVIAQAARDRAKQREQAPDCVHGTPNGTWVNDAGVVICPECRGKVAAS